MKKNGKLNKSEINTLKKAAQIMELWGGENDDTFEGSEALELHWHLLMFAWEREIENR